MPALRELNEEIDAKNNRVHELFQKGGPERNLTIEEVEEIRRLNTETTELGKKRDQLTELEAIEKSAEAERRYQRDPINRPSFPTGDGKSADREQSRPKSPGQAFVESDAFKNWTSRRAGQSASVDVPGVGLKATFTEGGATLTQYDRQPGLVMVATERLTVADLLSKGQTNQNTIRYIQEDTYTNAAAAVAEEGLKPEASFDTSEQDAPVRKIAVTAKVTDELFADFPAMRDYIDGRLRFMVPEKEEYYLLNGTGTAPQIKGILQFGTIQTQAKGGDAEPDAVYKAMTKIRSTGFFEPTGVVAHPNDWQAIRLLTTTDGIYLWGSPAEAGPERIWGLPVVVTTAMTENTMLVGAFRLGAQIFYREGVTVEATNTDQDDFVKNRITLRAEERLALAVYRPKAFCTVTGM